MRLFSKNLILLLLAVVTYSVSFAQNGLGTIAGKLMGDLQPIAGAEVVLLEKDKIIDKAITDEHGTYSFPYVRPGKYDVKASKAEYRTTIISYVPVSENYTTENDIYLGRYNNAHMPKTPFVDTYRDNWRKYMRNK